MTRRPRRNRKNSVVRSHIRETHLGTEHLIYPLFLLDGKNKKIEIESMPNIFRLSLDNILKEVRVCLQLGIRTFVLFPAVEESLKDKTATYSYQIGNFYCAAISSIKKHFPEACIMTDVAMDPYSSDGHDGLVENGQILNDETLPILVKMSVAQAAAGADIIGPSDMMDGRVGAIREGLDVNGFENVAIMSYTAKYASAFYGPFRDALDSAPKSGDKKTYQMDPANREEAIKETLMDIEEGADIVMVKPGLCYLDIVR
ncbi:MAG: porphobilinogen synthase, partial [Chitinophagales bacterium]